VSNPEIERLVQDRSLVRESFDDEQVAGYWSKAVASFASARADGLFSGTAFQAVYTGALQAALSVLAAHNLKVRGVSNHYVTFYAVQKLGPGLRDCGRRFDALRLARHQSVYEPEHDEEEMQQRLGRAMETLREGLPAVRSEIVSVRPSVVAMLAPLPV
jgi:hypothetical protein